MVAGDVLFLSLGKQAQAAWIKPKLDKFRKLVRTGRRPNLSEAEKAQHRDDSVSLLQEIKGDLEAAARAGEKTPAFGSALITLWRTGQVRIKIEREDMFTGPEVRGHQVLIGSQGNVWTEPTGPLAKIFDTDLEQRSKQLFFCIRELAHNHYHHDPESDLLTTAYPWEQGDDERWRRETQYGLVRMAIALRRRDTAFSYKRALGILAYADAFQRHMCGWQETSPGTTKDSELRFAYDFTALRASIDASLKVRELTDTQRMRTLLFCFATLITALGIVVSGLRSGEYPASAAYFKGMVDFATAHPLFSLGFAWGVAWGVDAAFVQMSLKPKIFANLPGGLSRLLDGLMGSLRRNTSAGIAFTLALLALGCVVLVSMLISVVLVFAAVTLTDRNNCPPAVGPQAEAIKDACTERYRWPWEKDLTKPPRLKSTDPKANPAKKADRAQP